MSSALVAIPLALATTSVFNAGLIVEKRALSRMPALSPRQPGRAIAGLLSSPAWLAGLAMIVTGLGCQVVVLALEPISLVQPVLAAGVAVSLVLSRLVLREQMGRAEFACVAVLVASLVALALSQDATRGVSTWRPGVVPVVALVGPSLAIGLVTAAWPWRARSAGQPASGRSARATALCAGIGAGLLYGVGSLATKGLSDVLGHGHGRGAAGLGAGIVSSPYLYLLAVCSAVAMLLYQAALQACRASVLIPVTNVVSNAYFVIAGTWLFHEPLPASPVKLALRLAGIAAAGLVLVLLTVQATDRPASQPGSAQPAVKREVRVKRRVTTRPRVPLDLAGLVLAALASFCAVSAAFPGWSVAGRSAQTPAAGHQVITLTGTGASYLSPATLDEVTGANLQVTETITATVSPLNSALAVWTVQTATYDTTRHLQLEPKSRTLVFNRSTAQLVDCCDANVNGNGLIRQTGIAGYVFPAGTRAQTYEVFDATLNAPEPFRYIGAGTVDGIGVYRFAEHVTGAPAGYLLVPFRDPELYTTDQVYSVDPRTGAVLAASEHEDLSLAQTITRSPVTRIFAATLTTTPATVAALVRADAGGQHETERATRIRVGYAIAAAVLALLAGSLIARHRGVGRGWPTRRRRVAQPPASPDADLVSPVSERQVLHIANSERHL